MGCRKTLFISTQADRFISGQNAFEYSASVISVRCEIMDHQAFHLFRCENVLVKHVFIPFLFATDRFWFRVITTQIEQIAERKLTGFNAVTGTVYSTLSRGS